MYKLTKAERAFIEEQVASKRQAMAQVDRVVFRRHSQSAGASVRDERPESHTHSANRRDDR